MNKSILIGILIILVVGGFFLLKAPSTVDHVVSSPSPSVSVKANTSSLPSASVKVSPAASIKVSPAPSSSPKASAAASPKASPSPTPAGSVQINVSITNFAFMSAAVTVKKGDKIVFTNKDSAPHTVTTKGTGWDSGTLSKDKSFTLDTSTLAPGTYEYICNFHPSMKGTVVVQ